MPEPAACPICDARPRPARRDWLWCCPACGYWGSRLAPALLDECARARLAEAARAEGLRRLRAGNFARLLDRLAALRSLGGVRLLEVGCGHGWFLEAAAARGAEVTGIEPDPEIGGLARARGLAVLAGLFPEAVPAGRCYDVVVFNDSFEHLPEPRAAAAACRDLLAPGGLAVVNLPLSSGVFYRTALALDRLGRGAALDRLWQRGLPSPHLGYYRQHHLARLFAGAGLAEVHRSTLRTLEVAGLWSRLTYVDGGAPVRAALTWLVLAAAAPLLGLLPADIGLQMFAAPSKPPPG